MGIKFIKSIDILDFCSSNICGNKIHKISLKQSHLLIFHISTVQHTKWSPWIWRNRAMFERLSVHFKTISVPFTCNRTDILCYHCIHLWGHGVDYSLLTKAMARVSVLNRSEVMFMHEMSASIHALFCHFVSHFIRYKMYWKWLSVHCGDWDT